MGRKVAELNTLSDGKGITGIRFFNEMEDTNEIICDHSRKRPQMQASSFYVYMTEYGGWRWRLAMSFVVEAV